MNHNIHNAYDYKSPCKPSRADRFASPLFLQNRDVTVTNTFIVHHFLPPLFTFIMVSLTRIKARFLFSAISTTGVIFGSLKPVLAFFVQYILLMIYTPFVQMCAILLLNPSARYLLLLSYHNIHYPRLCHVRLIV